MAKEIARYNNSAVKIDGMYIEELIEGYATLSSKGRGSMERQFETITVAASDGETPKYNRYPARTITVEFLIRGGDLNQKMEHLMNILSADQSDFIFNDEPDKFFTGMAIAPNETETGVGWVHGNYTIYCAYPFKRSVDVKVAEVPYIINDHDAEFRIQYEGTYPAKPILRAEFAGAKVGGDYSEDGDCGYVAFIDESGNIIQLGNPEVVDIDAYTMADQLINRLFDALNAWQQSGGKTYGNKAVTGSVGTTTINDIHWGEGVGQALSFAVPSYGSGNAWHGPILWKNTTGAINFELAIVHRMCASDVSQVGTFECGVYNNTNGMLTMVAGIVIEKTAAGTTGIVRYIVNGKSVGTDSIDLSYYNVNFGYCKRTQLYKTQYYNKKTKKWGDTKAKKKKVRGGTRKVKNGFSYSQSNLNTNISKSNGQITFKVGNLAQRTFQDDDISLTPAHNVSFHFGQQKSLPQLHTNAVSSARFTKNPPSGKFADIPNVFTSGDMVEADCGDASIYIKNRSTIDGHYAPEYGALGNDWEGFQLAKGMNIIDVVWSDWVNTNYKPTIRILYNEVFL